MDTIALILSIVGCLNWGLIGLLDFDLVADMMTDVYRGLRKQYGLE